MNSSLHWVQSGEITLIASHARFVPPIHIFLSEQLQRKLKDWIHKFRRLVVGKGLRYLGINFQLAGKIIVVRIEQQQLQHIVGEDNKSTVMVTEEVTTRRVSRALKVA